MDRIRVGIIGCGGIFRGLHAPYYQEPTRRADIVAIADINEASANEQANQFGADAYTDYRALLDKTGYRRSRCLRPSRSTPRNHACCRRCWQAYLDGETDVLQRRGG